MYYSAKQYGDYILGSQDNIRDSWRAAQVKTAYNRIAALRGTQPLLSGEKLTRKHVAVVLRDLKADMVARGRWSDDSNRWDERQPMNYGKWTRPWEVVPELRNYRPPAGDFGVGIEVEMGFKSKADAQYIARKIKNWRYITLDFEGGEHPIEATFPPVNYSRFNKNSQAMRYLKILNKEKDRVEEHFLEDSVGTHVNVSSGDVPNISGTKIQNISNILIHLTDEQKYKYFGRRPYGYGYVMNTDGGATYVEWKLFNSTIDVKRLRQYVDVAVALTALGTSDTPINETTVVAALEKGWNKSGYKWDFSGYEAAMAESKYDYDETEECDCPECRADRGEDNYDYDDEI